MKTLAEKVKAIEDNLKKLQKDEYDCLMDFYNHGKGDIEFVYNSMLKYNLIKNE